jgi:hypothetical protein
MTVFICKDCVFLCNYESDFKRHLKTKKHIKNTENESNNNVVVASKMNKKIIKKSSIERCESEDDDKFLIHVPFAIANSRVDEKGDVAAASIEEYDDDDGVHECECGKTFKSSSGLRKHKRHLCCTKDNIIMKLIKDNAEMKELMREQQKFMREQQEQYHKQLVEMIPMVCATNNTNLITNNHNHMSIKQKFNLNVFLNEQCKDALNIGDFINSLQITLDDLSVTREKTLEDSVENIFLRGLKELDIYKRPIHCTDHKRDVMYIKDEEKWEKDEGNIKLKDTIGAISRKQIKKLKEWKDSDPEVTKTTSVKNDKFLLTLNHVCTPIPEVSEKRLIKTIGKEVQID